MRGRWRLFRHEAGRTAGPPPWAYVALFSACLLIGGWSAQAHGAVVIWPANAIMLAALLQLKRRQAITVLATCFVINVASNVVRGDPMPFLWLNAVMNLGQAVLAGLIARRVCGAALDLRRPRRLINFALLAVAPSVALSALLNVTTGAALRDFTLPIYLFSLHRYFDVELLGILIVTPTLLLMARAHRFQDVAKVSRLEVAALVGLVALVATAVFWQSTVSAMFLIFPPMAMIAFRLSPPWAALSVILVAAIGGAATLSGHGPVLMTRLLDIRGLEDVPELQRQLSVYHLFLLAVVVTALPISTMTSERRRLILCLRARTQTAQDARLRAEQADAAKSRFLALMSHEMRTPLHSVVGYAEVLSRRADMDPDAVRQTELIQSSGAALLTLVEDVLEVSRGDDMLCLGTVQLVDVLAQATAPSREVAQAKGLDVRVETTPAARAPVTADGRRLRQALQKLVCNAVKFTETGEVVVAADRVGDDVVITVSDTGCGIDAALEPRLFDAFVQGDDSIGRAHVGAGLGLTVVRRLAAMMGGGVSVAGRPAGGAVFTLRMPLPLAAVEATVPASPDQVSADDACVPRVLVVDDHPANREVARLMLMSTGCDILEAVDGLEAVEMVRTQPFDLILMDVRMPRMDGLAATRAIRALPSPMNAVPILAVTADAMSEDAARCIAAGMNGHLAKPITHATLYAAIDRVMAQVDGVDAAAA